MICSNGHENTDGQAFCGTCGEPLTPPVEGLGSGPESEPAEGTAQREESERTKVPTSVIVAYGALGAAFLGSFLPWARVFFVTVNGTDGDGNITAISSAAAAIALAVALRSRPANRALLFVALALSAVCAGVYLYDSNQLTSAFVDEADAGMFGEIEVTPQLGLYLGAFGAILGVGATLLLVIRSYRPDTLNGVPPATLLALGAGLYALALSAVPGWWGLTTLAALVALVLGYTQRRDAAAPVNRLATLALGAGALGLLGAVGGFVLDDDEGSSLAQCTDVFEEGATTDPAWEDDGVTCEEPDGSTTYVITWESFCFDDDDPPLVNDYGWGHEGEPWHADEEPPDC